MTRPALLAAMLLAVAGQSAPAVAADRNYSVTSFDRIRLDGAYRVRLVTGVAPFARASGPQQALDQVAIDVQGRTLVVRANRSSWGGYPGEASGPLTIEVGTHELSAAWVNGAGSLAIDRVRGLSFDLAIQGSGSAEIGAAEVDQLKIGISGAASARLAGAAPKVTAIVRGNSVLDAAALSAKDATIGVEGPSSLTMTVANEAQVDAKGLATVQLNGGPACTVKAQGSASVAGCRGGSSR